jgi:hypothetical protein
MKKLIMILMILILAGTAAAGWWETDSNLICWYKMDDNADSTVVIDSCGLSNGTFNGTDANTSAHHTTGKVGGALMFNGTSDYVDTNATFQTTFRNSFSINLWAKPDDGQSELVVNKVICGIDLFFDFTGSTGTNIAHITNGRVSVNWVNQDEGMILSTPVWADGTTNWTMITQVFTVITATSAKIGLYVNGEFISESDVIEFSNPISSINYLGYRYYLGATNSIDNDGGPFADYKFIGSLDDVMIFNKALSEDEITQLYNVNGHRNCVPLLMHNKRHRCD